MEAIFDSEAYWRKTLAGPFMGTTALIGFELVDLDAREGWCRASFLLPKEAANPGGFAQGGMITACLDEVMSVAGAIIQSGPAMSPTLQMSVSFLRPVAIGEKLFAHGEVTKRGKAQIFTQGALTDSADKLLATATALCITRPMPEWSASAG